MVAWWHGGMVFLISGWAYVFFLNELVVVAWPSCGSMVDFIFYSFILFYFFFIYVSKFGIKCLIFVNSF